MFHQLCCGAACHPAPRICSVPGHGPLPHSAPEELAAGDTDGRCRALEAGPSPAMRAVAAWEPAKLAMGRCGARDVVCRDMLESSHDPLPRGSGRPQSPRCRPPVAVAELNISTCVRHVPHFIFHWAHRDRHVFEYRRWPLRYQVSLVSPVSRPARHPHFSRIPLALTQGEAADEAWAWKVGFTFPLGVPPKNTVQVPTSGWERCLRSRLLFSVSPSRGSPLEAQSRRRVRAQWTSRLDPAGFVFLTHVRGGAPGVGEDQKIWFAGVTF